MYSQCLRRRTVPAISPQAKPTTKDMRVRRLLVRVRVNPDIAATMVITTSAAISCIGPSDPIGHPSTAAAGSALSVIVRDQSEHEALAGDQHRFHHSAGQRRFFGVVDRAERELLDEPLDGQSSGTPEVDEPGDELLRHRVAFEYAGN